MSYFLGGLAVGLIAGFSLAVAMWWFGLFDLFAWFRGNGE